MKIVRGKLAGTVIDTKGAWEYYRKNPSDLDLAAKAAVHSAKQLKESMLVVAGNSYGSDVYHIIKATDDIRKITVITPKTGFKVLEALPDGKVYASRIKNNQ